MKAAQYYLNVIVPLINRTAYGAAQWEARGNIFDPECQLIIGSDYDSQEAARVMLERFGDLVMAANVKIGPFVFFELVFSPLANNPVAYYNRLPEKMPWSQKPRCADELVPADFSGFIHIPANAKAWESVTVSPRTTPFDLAALQAFVGGGIEFYRTDFRKLHADIYLNEIGELIPLTVNPLATAFVEEHATNLNCQYVRGDVLLTFGGCCAQVANPDEQPWPREA